MHQVARASEGTRNATLYWAACRFREMLGPDLTEGDATTFLLQAAHAAGLPHHEALATTRSGLHGLRS
jgi:hypothetical protein